MRRITDDQRRHRLAVRHHLTPRAARQRRRHAGRRPGGVARHRSGDRLPIRRGAARENRRVPSPRWSTALYDDRTLVRTLCMRRTMFVVPLDLVAVVQAACTDALVPGERRRLVRMLEENGIAGDGEAWLREVEAKAVAELDARGEATASELSKVVPGFREQLSVGEGKTWAGTMGVSTRVLFLLSTEQRVVRGRPRGSWTSSQYRWSPMKEWLPAGVTPMPADAARTELVRRWLTTYGPGTSGDIKWWTGWTVGQTKAALAAVGTIEVELDDGTGWLLPDDDRVVRRPAPWVALLPSLDPTTMGWQQRAWYLGDHGPALFDRNGNAGPTVWVDGRIVGGWSQRADRRDRLPAARGCRWRRRDGDRTGRRRARRLAGRRTHHARGSRRRCTRRCNDVLCGPSAKSDKYLARRGGAAFNQAVSSAAPDDGVAADRERGRPLLLGAIVVGAAVSLLLGVYGRDARSRRPGAVHPRVQRHPQHEGVAGHHHAGARRRADRAGAVAVRQARPPAGARVGRAGAPAQRHPHLSGQPAGHVPLPVVPRLRDRLESDPALRPLHPRLPVLRGLHRQGPLRPFLAHAELGAASGGRPGVRRARRPLVHQLVVVLPERGSRVSEVDAMDALKMLVRVVQIFTLCATAAFVFLLFVNEPSQPPPVPAMGSANTGASIFATRCASCHGADGGGGYGPALRGGIVVKQLPQPGRPGGRGDQRPRVRCRRSPAASRPSRSAPWSTTPAPGSAESPRERPRSTRRAAC